MCKVTKPSRRKKSFTGYKVVFKIGKKYYSPMTGIEYVTSKDVQAVDSIKEYKKHKAKIENDSTFIDYAEIIDKENGDHNTLYEPLMKGKTTVFLTKKDLHDRLKTLSDKVQIVKMTISKNLSNGIYSGWNGKTVSVILGDYIESIEEF